MIHDTLLNNNIEVNNLLLIIMLYGMSTILILYSLLSSQA